MARTNPYDNGDPSELNFSDKKGRPIFDLEILNEHPMVKDVADGHNHATPGFRDATFKMKMKKVKRCGTAYLNAMADRLPDSNGDEEEAPPEDTYEFPEDDE